MVFGRSNPTSFTNLMKRHSFLLEKVGEIPRMVACNKCDFPAAAAVCSWARELGFPVIHTSALRRTNVKHLFQATIEVLINPGKEINDSVEPLLILRAAEEPKRCC
jgi:hypothetical protein